MSGDTSTMTVPIAWIVATTYIGAVTRRAQVCVLCPLCHSVHFHGGGGEDGQVVRGLRSPHCKVQPPQGSSYELRWPDDVGAQVLARQSTSCHAITTRGARCLRAAAPGYFYCKSHDQPTQPGLHTGRHGEIRVNLDGVGAAGFESALTPKAIVHGDKGGAAFTRREMTRWERGRGLIGSSRGVHTDTDTIPALTGAGMNEETRAA